MNKEKVPPVLTKYGFLVNPEWIEYCFNKIFEKK